MWRSLVARVVRDDEVAGSIPVTPTQGHLSALGGGSDLWSFVRLCEILILLDAFPLLNRRKVVP